jgi:Glycosyl transferase family 2.
VVEIIIPVGPGDRADWLDSVLKKVSAFANSLNYKIIVYDNSEREDLAKVISRYSVNHVTAKRFKKVNMAKLRNEMLKLANESYVVMLDSDVIPSEKALPRMIENLKNGVTFTWMHYAYDEKE